MTGTRPNRPLVTFPLFAYNQERYIREAIKGAFSQTYKPLEIILSDDCSNDRTFEIMQEMAAAYEGPHEVHVRQNAVNLGLAKHINSIIPSAKGEVICWAAGDDISLPSRVDLLVAPILRRKDVFGAHSSVIEINLSGKRIGTRRPHHLSNELTSDAVIKDCLSIVSQTYAFRKEVFTFFGHFHSNLTNEGPPMTFRTLSLGRIEFINEPTVCYRIGSGVSTYAGSDVERLRISEPIKISNWRKSSYRQFWADSRKNKKLYSRFRREILVNYLFHRYAISISEKPFQIKTTFRAISLNKRPKAVIRSLIRRNLPTFLYKWIQRRQYS